MDVERLRSVARVEPEVGPQPGRLDEDLGAFVSEEVDVAGRLEVPAEGEHHRRVDVVLRRAGGVVRRCLLAVDRPPRIQRPDLAHLAGTGARRVEHRPAEPDHLARRLLVGVGEERHDVHLGVPEVVAVVAAGAHALGGDALLLGARRRLGELEEVPTHRLLVAFVATEFDVGGRPERIEPLGLLGEQVVEPVGLGPFEGPRATIGEFLGRDPGRGVVRDEFGDADRFARRWRGR